MRGERDDERKSKIQRGAEQLRSTGDGDSVGAVDRLSRHRVLGPVDGSELFGLSNLSADSQRPADDPVCVAFRQTGAVDYGASRFSRGGFLYHQISRL